MLKLFKRFLGEEDGLNTVEIVVIVGLSILLFVAIIKFLGPELKDFIKRVWEKVTGAEEDIGGDI